MAELTDVHVYKVKIKGRDYIYINYREGGELKHVYLAPWDSSQFCSKVEKLLKFKELFRYLPDQVRAAYVYRLAQLREEIEELQEALELLP